MRGLHRGIEPIIAVVILVAVTLVLAIGVIGWIMGWWGTLGGTETLQIMPYSELLTDGTIRLNITNLGTMNAYITKIEVVGIGTCELPQSPATIEAGREVEVTANCEDEDKISAGTRYTVRVYTKAGNVYSMVLEAKPHQT